MASQPKPASCRKPPVPLAQRPRGHSEEWPELEAYITKLLWDGTSQEPRHSNLPEIATDFAPSDQVAPQPRHLAMPPSHGRSPRWRPASAPRLSRPVTPGSGRVPTTRPGMQYCRCRTPDCQMCTEGAWQEIAGRDLALRCFLAEPCWERRYRERQGMAQYRRDLVTELSMHHRAYAHKYGTQLRAAAPASFP